MNDQLALDVAADVDVHACDFILRGAILRCLICGVEKPPPSWSIAEAPSHDWELVSVTDRASGPLIFYQCRHCGLGASQTHRVDVEPNPAPTCRAKAHAARESRP